jgi:hypothetical protein
MAYLGLLRLACMSLSVPMRTSVFGPSLTAACWSYIPAELPSLDNADIQIQAAKEVRRLEALVGVVGRSNKHREEQIVIQLGSLDFIEASESVVQSQRDGLASQPVNLGALPDVYQRQIDRVDECTFDFPSHARDPVQVHALLFQVADANQQAAEDNQMLPSLASVVGTGDDSTDPVIERQTTTSGQLPWLELRGLVPAHVVVVVDDGRDGRVEDGEQAEGSAHAIRAVPQSRGSEEVRGEKAEVMGVAQGDEQRRRRGKDPVAAVSECAVWGRAAMRTAACPAGRYMSAASAAASRGGGQPASWGYVACSRLPERRVDMENGGMGTLSRRFTFTHEPRSGART